MGQNGKVLVVEDDVHMSLLLRMVLEEAGYEVETAENGLVALNRLDSFTPSIILLDLKMPVMNGWEFARHFRERHEASIPIVVVSAADDMRQRVQEIGAVAGLAKPFHIDEITCLVSEILSSSSPL